MAGERGRVRRRRTRGRKRGKKPFYNRFSKKMEGGTKHTFLNVLPSVKRGPSIVTNKVGTGEHYQRVYV